MKSTSFPQISVLMPAYNAGLFIREAIQSVLSQTFRDFELIVINDGSQDNTVEVVKSIDDPRIIFIDNEINKKKAPCLNQGLDLAKGKYITIVDADDIALPQKLEKQFHFMEENKEVGACGTMLKYIGKKGFEKEVVWPVGYEDIYFHLLTGCYFNFPLIRKEVLTENNLIFDPDYLAEDYLLWIKLADVTKIVTLPEVLYSYRMHHNQISITHLEKINSYVRLEQDIHFKNMYSKIMGHKLDSSFVHNTFDKLSLQDIKDYEKIIKELFIKNREQQIFNSQKLEYYLSRIWYKMFHRLIVLDFRAIKYFIAKRGYRKKTKLNLKNYSYMMFLFWKGILKKAKNK